LLHTSNQAKLTVLLLLALCSSSSYCHEQVEAVSPLLADDGSNGGSGEDALRIMVEGKLNEILPAIRGLGEWWW